jgi:hypothetical protein
MQNQDFILKSTCQSHIYKFSLGEHIIYTRYVCF